jgi:hypothetical protein
LEIEAFDQNGNNVALASEGATASQSSTYLWGGTTACPASIAIDGHTDERGGITNNEQSPWITIDLGKYVGISRIKIWNRKNAAVSCFQAPPCLFLMRNPTWLSKFSTLEAHRTLKR